MDDYFLPDLPKSDDRSLAYNKEAKDFWMNNHVQTINVAPFDIRKCDHYFIRSQETGYEVICQKCHFGLSGSIEIREGKLFHKGEPVGI